MEKYTPEEEDRPENHFLNPVINKSQTNNCKEEDKKINKMLLQLIMKIINEKYNNQAIVPYDSTNNNNDNINNNCINLDEVNFDDSLHQIKNTSLLYDMT